MNSSELSPSSRRASPFFVSIGLAFFALFAAVSFGLASVPQGESAGSGFVILLKNGSSVMGKILSRDEATGSLRLTMTESASGQPKSFAIIAMDDAESIRASSSETDSITIRLLGGSELRCREFTLSGDSVVVKLGTASRIEVMWEQIESIRFGG